MNNNNKSTEDSILPFSMKNNTTQFKVASIHQFYSIDYYIEMVNNKDCHVINVDMATQTQWFDENVIFKIFSEIKNENTLNIVSKQIQAYYNYYLSCEDYRIGSKNEEGNFIPHCVDFPQRLKNIKERMFAQKSALANLSLLQTEMFDYFNQSNSENIDEEFKNPQDKSKVEILQIPMEVRKIICLSEEKQIKDFAQIIQKDITTWVNKHKCQYWDIVYLELLNMRILKIGTSRRKFSQLIEYFTTIKNTTIYNSMVKNYSHGQTVDWYKKQPDSSEAQLIGKEIRELFSSLG